MIFKITKWIFRQMPDKWRRWIMIVAMIESALVRPGGRLSVELTLSKDGNHEVHFNRVGWSFPKKERARTMLAKGCSHSEVAEAFGVTVFELGQQLMEEDDG